MRVYFHLGSAQHNEYTIELIMALCRRYGLELTSSPDEADIVLVSVCDISEIGILRQARKYGKPVLAGGFVSILPVLRCYADYVCVGEGYGCLRELAGMRSVDQLERLPQIATRDRPHQRVDEEIDWAVNPVVQVSKTSYYYYTGKGCPVKCKFCLLSYSRHLQDAPVVHVRRAIRALPPKAKLYLMTSYFRYDLTPAEQRRLGTLDVTIREYLKGKQHGLRRVRCGIEFWTEGMRRDLAKPLSTQQLGDFVAMTGANGAETIAYLIAGVEPMEALQELADALPGGADIKPRFVFAPTVFDPQPYTPLADYDIRQRHEFDHKRAMALLNSRNRRIRVHRPAKPSHASWRTVMQRAMNIEEAEFCWRLRSIDDNDKLLREVETNFQHLLGTKSIDELRNERRRFDPALWGDDAESLRPVKLSYERSS